MLAQVTNHTRVLRVRHFSTRETAPLHTIIIAAHEPAYYHVTYKAVTYCTLYIIRNVYRYCLPFKFTLRQMWRNEQRDYENLFRALTPRFKVHFLRRCYPLGLMASNSKTTDEWK
jgi:hypothetical protein